jgi:hypothetical protein
MLTTDTLIYTLFGETMTRVSEPRNPEKCNFVIMCNNLDWSGFRTLAGCERQFAELEDKARRFHRPDGYYTVVER